MSIVYTLYLVACLDPMCHYVMPAKTYESERSCRLNAAMIAGMKRASDNRPIGNGFNYHYECRPIEAVAGRPLETTPPQGPAPAASRI